MEHLIDPELEELEKILIEYPNLSKAFPNGIIDPCPKYCDVFDQTTTWFFGARKSWHTETSIIETSQRGFRLQEKLKVALPERAGTFVTMAIIVLYCFFVT